MQKDIIIKPISNSRMMIEFTPSKTNQAVSIDVRCKRLQPVYC